MISGKGHIMKINLYEAILTTLRKDEEFCLPYQLPTAILNVLPITFDNEIFLMDVQFEKWFSNLRS